MKMHDIHLDLIKPTHFKITAQCSKNLDKEWLFHRILKEKDHTDVLSTGKDYENILLRQWAALKRFRIMHLFLLNSMPKNELNRFIQVVVEGDF